MSEDLGPTIEAAVLEPWRLQELADELGDSTPALGFLANYLSMLPDRILNISRGLCRHDAVVSMDAILSLKISSAMVGALETEGQCEAIELMIREDQFDSAVRAFPALQQSTDRCFAAGPQLLRKARESLCSWPRTTY
ncbi:Hpt domain-containing protein [Arthrobacter sp. ISL-95]|uniref:Hpt domain-containing protein n=1 Tax=Arthrobacter sp. ISL-95 TaxID=2819116 RepID=UPI001BE7BFC9|nr:Hpt domain-containing protein [Arthrobacter sp. ISL-95]MBT2588258.1 Hpt domain-containing protein [Arthrobacter sp. ISL-95]